MKKLPLLALLLILVYVSAYAGNDTVDIPHGTKVISPCTPIINYGNGVYYFPCVSVKFGLTLSRFKRENPLFTITAISGNGTSGPGRYDRGYFVVVKKRTPLRLR